MFTRIVANSTYPIMVHSTDPWLITIDDFITPEECKILIELGAKTGYKRSADVGEMLEDGTYSDDVNEGRTSTNAWCEDDCEPHPLVQRVWRRIEDLTQLHRNYSEPLQLLRYEKGQVR
jgi:prolyl 4-hydroxylase